MNHADRPPHNRDASGVTRKPPGRTDKPAQGNTETADNARRIARIRREISADGDRWRERFPILANQNLIGLGIFVIAVAGVGVSGFAYIEGHIGWYICIPLVAFFTSLLHELEHDLIHWQYFRQHKFLHHSMLLVGWVLRPGTINPWIRRRLHFQHHKLSGTEKDMEERGIGNGQQFGALRLLTMLDTFTGNLVNVWMKAPGAHRLRLSLRIVAANFPFAVLCAITWYGFLMFHGMDAMTTWLGIPIAWSEGTLALVSGASPWIVILIAPFYLRSFCLNFISSNMHYFGDVDSLMKQTQVLNHWILWPFQLFCFNFGSTHGIHHFVVREPFYIRQLTARTAHRVMREEGVRFNDLGTFSRANRFTALAVGAEHPVAREV